MIFRATDPVLGTRMLSVPIEGGPVVLVPVCYVEGFDDYTRELFSVPFGGSEPPRRLHPPHTPGTNILEVQEAVGRSFSVTAMG